MALEIGKLPAEILGKWLGEVGQRGFQHSPDTGIVIGPGTGEDTAAIDLADGSDALLIVTSDPVTFTARDIGDYSIGVNANDIATSGGVPRWFFATVLLPPGTGEHEAIGLLNGIETACRRRGIAVAGGHTEITDAVTRPVVSGTMIGTVQRDRFLDKRRIRPGDLVYLTKGIAVEGTAILATEYVTRLEAAGIDQHTLDTARGMIDLLDISPEAGIACDTGGVSALHDVTEGGVATAVSELSVHAGIRIDAARIPILPCCKSICDALSIDPLGLIGSGSLLIVCKANRGHEIEAAITRRGIACTRIGSVVSVAPGTEWWHENRPIETPVFAVDEIARLSTG